MTELQLQRSPKAVTVLTTSRVQIRKRQVNQAVRWLGLLAFLLLAVPRLRIVIASAPIYAIDILAALVYMAANRMPAIKWSTVKPLPTQVSLFLVFMMIGELNGLLIYGAFLESIYVFVEYSLALSLFFTIPRVLSDTKTMAIVLNGIVAGSLCTSVITIMYALGPTRALVMNTIFSSKYLVPTAERMAQRILAQGGMAEAMRGQSLIGVSTITTGFLGIAWAFAFLAANWPEVKGKWQSLANLASIVTPIAILMTYGRTAWLTVIAIGSLSLFFGFAKGRRNMVILVFSLVLVVYQVGWQSEWFMVNRVVDATQRTLENPYQDYSTARRLTSYTQIFSHIAKHPAWIVLGAGRIGKRLAVRGDLNEELRDISGMSTHSGFAMAYYCYGMMGAIIHAFIVLNGLRFILKRLSKHPLQGIALYKTTWQTFLMAWFGLLFWWLTANGMIAEGRGVILFFLFYGLMMACHNILSNQTQEVIQS